MSTSPAIQQAVALLTQRRGEVMQAVDELQDELGQITNALESLGYGSKKVVPITPPPPAENESGTPNAPANDAFEGLSVAAATRLVLESERGPWTPSLVRDRLSGTAVRQDRDDANFITAIRTAFYSLRQRKLVVTDENNRTMARSWVEDAEAPARTGASESEESVGDSSRKEGGTADGAVPPVGRDGSGNSELSHGHGHRASIVEATG